MNFALIEAPTFICSAPLVFFELTYETLTDCLQVDRVEVSLRFSLAGMQLKLSMLESGDQVLEPLLGLVHLRRQMKAEGLPAGLRAGL